MNIYENTDLIGANCCRADAHGDQSRDDPVGNIPVVPEPVEFSIRMVSEHEKIVVRLELSTSVVT